MSIQLLWFLREAGQTKRNHAWRTVAQQTTGQHSYNAVMIYLTLHPNPNMEVVKALLYHDCGERGAGDMPATAKNSDPKLRERYEDLELSVLEKWIPDYSLLIDSLTLEDMQWLSLCDSFEFALFCLEELALGNQYADSRLKTVTSYLETAHAAGAMPHELEGLYRCIARREVMLFSDEEIIE